jgi:hypothetical protein
LAGSDTSSLYEHCEFSEVCHFQSISRYNTGLLFHSFLITSVLIARGEKYCMLFSTGSGYSFSRNFEESCLKCSNFTSSANVHRVNYCVLLFHWREVKSGLGPSA